MPRITTLLTSILLLSCTGVAAQTSTGSERGDRQAAASSDEAQVFQSAFRMLADLHMDALSDSALWESALAGMVEGLNDPYASVFTPVEADAWDEETTGNYSGIGVQITMLNDEITVTAVFRSTPAEGVGMQVGDVIVGVDDNDATSWDTAIASDSIRGPVGTVVQVRVKRAGFEQPIAYDIRRNQVHVPAVLYGMMDNGIAYVIMDRVARNAAREMDEALRTMHGAKGMIIDLRRNPGGFLDESLMLADLFLEPGSTLASTSQRVRGGSAAQVTSESYEDRWPIRVPELPIIVLVDGYTASGAEILAGALQDYDRAIVLGERSFGKGLVQTVAPLPAGRKLRFTTGSWHTPLGRSLHRARDKEGRPLPEALDSLPRVRTAGGRDLIAAGGIFPDLAIVDDTLRLAERELLRMANEARFPLVLRLAEFSFGEAGRLREADPVVVDVSRADFEEWVGQMVAEGLPADAVADPVARDYLFWRARLGVAQRLDVVGTEAAIRMERDPVITRAVGLLAAANSQADLFSAVRKEQPARTAGTPSHGQAR
ncbi:MAG: S41 family peptidase [Gemmatimonadota bacterium]|nr:S41 family peptidase [Gemmatimonadota bacterium]MDH5760171.1 S41 family peptidase [Gemmatimonadota bacterium]